MYRYIVNGSSRLAQGVQLGRAIFWRALKKAGLTPSYDTLEDQGKDRIAPFDEYPPCEMCGSKRTAEKLVARDGSRIVECQRCGLWFTSPRIRESVWTNYLKEVTSRSIEFTENRLRYGAALSSNTKYALPDWYERRMKRENLVIEEMEEYLDKEIRHLHDVGCGVGYLLQAAQKRGIEATGNELNAYACQVMRERFGITVYNDNLPNILTAIGTQDAVVMNDYIEHTYHPLRDLQTAHSLLRQNGVLFVKTFHIDCRTFDRLGRDWNMLFWNHTYHFSTKTLSDIINKVGFKILDTKAGYENDLITIIAQRDNNNGPG